MIAADGRGRAPEELLSNHLARVYKYGYWISLLLIALGVLLSYIVSDTLGVAAVAGVVVLLATPLVAAIWVGVTALTERDWRLVLIVAGILSLLAVSVLLQLA
jgi:hypothetical protein